MASKPTDIIMRRIIEIYKKNNKRFFLKKKPKRKFKRTASAYLGRCNLNVRILIKARIKV